MSDLENLLHQVLSNLVGPPDTPLLWYLTIGHLWALIQLAAGYIETPHQVREIIWHDYTDFPAWAEILQRTIFALLWPIQVGGVVLALSYLIIKSATVWTLGALCTLVSAPITDSTPEV